MRKKTKKPTPREGSMAAQIIETKNLHPDWTREDIAEYIGGCHVQYITATCKKFKHLLKKIAPPVAEKPPAPEKPAAPKKPLLDKDGTLRGGNGRYDYALKGVRKGGGPVDGMEGLSMQFMIVDGNAAANVREAQAYISSMRVVLSGLETVEKEMENPENLGFHAVQVSNIMNAANRVKDKFIETFQKREKDHQTFVKSTKKEMPKAAWVANFEEVDTEKAVPAE